MKHIPHLWIESDERLRQGVEIMLTPSQSHHLVIVMRLVEGADVTLANGCDGTWSGILAKAHKKKAVIRLGQHIQDQEVKRPITAIMPILHKERMAWVWEKAVELGAGVVQPITTEFTQAHKFREDKAQAGMVEALRQCGGNVLPELKPVESLRSCLHQWPEDIPIFCGLERADNVPALHEAVTSLRAKYDGTLPPCGVLVGPEGGWSDDERMLICDHKAIIPVTLGTRTLRAETALTVLLGALID